MKLRMVPVGTVFRHYVRVVRDIAAAVGKEARLAMEGEDAEIDLNLVEAIKDPLTHLVRNAIDHGIETPDIRRAQGKNSCGLLLLRAFRDSGSMVIQLLDDGTGLNRERILARAREQGLITDTEKISDHELYQLVFEPSFSTVHVVTDLSGRGMGMDIVRRNIEALRGSVHLESAAGKGVTVTMRLPLTLAIIEGFAVAAGGDTYVLPLHAVRECLTLPPKEGGKAAFGIIDLRGEPLPCMRLRHLFAIPGTCVTRESVVVISADGITAGIVVDGLYGPRQTVVKPLGKHFQRIPGITGSAILGNGRVALIVDVAGLLREVVQSTAGDNHDAPGLSALEF
jgi:two-component system chemotaxis sensor kinase CheA